MPNVVETMRIRTQRAVDGLYRGGKGRKVCLAIEGAEYLHYIPVPRPSVLSLLGKLKASNGEYLEATLDEDYVWLRVRSDGP